ncbi:hypothetical protein HPB50_002909 [Hyalomma asiaticum]|uniref:Uncharacterized protein n=1 Tax=Hyalomma asiaticum TaxID=266040 RepID=A0ACB7TDL5_HYAAI|nr:hypothetical protein HPB50_002909 [Hyalomma asiaticum]
MPWTSAGKSDERCAYKNLTSRDISVEQRTNLTATTEENGSSNTKPARALRPSFPRTRREYWVKFCRDLCLRDKTPGQLRFRVVCSLHFREAAFLRPGFLRRDAVPTIFPVIGTRSNNHDDACGDRGLNHVQPSKTEESGSPGHVSSYIQENALSVGCQMPDETAARKVSSLAEHPDNVLVDNAVPAQEARVNADPQAALPQAPTINSAPGVAAEVLSKSVAALVEAQLRMNNVSRFGRRWSSQNKSFALGLYFHSPKGYRRVTLQTAPLVGGDMMWDTLRMASEMARRVSLRPSQSPRSPAKIRTSRRAPGYRDMARSLGIP